MPPTDLRSWMQSALVLAASVLLVGCGAASSEMESPLFTRLPSDSTGITFSNELTEGPERNVFTYTNFYNGGGVAVGDLTGNGRPDLYFTANQEANALYLNEGNFQFRDVTSAAGVGDPSGWTTGVTMADVNGDGRLDIYVCKSGWHPPGERRNRLYVHQGLDAEGVPQFEERAAAYGLDDPAHSTHATFFDYDRDGDLDLFLLNHATGRTRAEQGGGGEQQGRDPMAADKLYRNDGGTFTDVSETAGITGAAAYGLSVTVSDVNRDGWPDVYVANDFVEDDRLYVNQGDGTFEEDLRSRMDHISYSSMGADIADYDNDGWPDVYTLDMLAEGRPRQKLLYLETVRSARSQGHYYQHQRNMLQRNNGNGHFSEIGQLAGVSSTDWSWAALFSDFDLDGYKDLYVTNGYRRDLTDLDYKHSVLASNPNYLQFLRDQDPRSVDLYGLLQQMPSTPLPNYAFRNEGDLTFDDASDEWGLATEGFSSGAAYADLNNDGAPDLVVNNLAEEAFVYRNNARRRTENHFLTVELDGPEGNRFGVGASVQVSTPDRTFYQEMIPARGFQSSVEQALHFGLGTADTVSVTVTWPDQRRETLRGVQADQTITLHHDDARPSDQGPAPDPRPWMDAVADERGLTFTHRENAYDDFEEEPLLPHMHSRLGPALAHADVTGNGRNDVFVGGAQGQASVLFRQRPDETFEKSSPEAFAKHRSYEDVDAAFLDVDRDGDRDLYVVSGGKAAPSSSGYQDRLYLNDGTGTFTYAPEALPTIESSGGVVAVHDYNADGYPDLFVGGRISPGAFPTAPRSYLLENTGRRFEDVTEEVAPPLTTPGMITDALWADFTGNGRAELVLAGEWMPLRAFRVPEQGPFEEVTKQMGLDDTNGWWYALAARDLDGDVDADLVAANRGLNAQVQASPEAPAALYAADFSRDGSVDPIMTHHLDGREYPVYWHDTLVEAIPPFEERFDSYEDYATSTIGEILTAEEREMATRRTVSTFETSLFENRDDGSFRRHALPLEAQFAPIHDLLVRDVNEDGRPDLLLAGNDFTVRPQWGRADAEKGTILRNEGNLQFEAVRSHESGFVAPGDVRDLALLPLSSGSLILVGNNSAPLNAFHLRPRSRVTAERPASQSPARP